MVGAEGFEPSNTGSKGRRLTAWPRPNTPGPGAPAPRTLRREVETLIVAEFTEICPTRRAAFPGPVRSHYFAVRHPILTNARPCAHIRGGSVFACAATAIRAAPGRWPCAWPRRHARTGRKRPIPSPTWRQTSPRHRARTAEYAQSPGDARRRRARDRCEGWPTTPASPAEPAEAAGPSAAGVAPRPATGRHRPSTRRSPDAG